MPAEGMTGGANARMIHPASNGGCLPFHLRQLVENSLYLLDALAPEERRPRGIRRQATDARTRVRRLDYRETAFRPKLGQRGVTVFDGT